MYQAIDSSWHSTDGEAVPVRIANTKEENASQNANPLPPRYAVRISHGSTSMGLAAATGVGIVVLAVSLFYVGIDALRGELTGGNTVDVAILENGEFEPSTVRVAVGDTLVITSNHKDPQVLKHTADSDKNVEPLVETPLVLFTGEPYSKKVPENTSGNTYVFASSTVDNASTLTVLVGDSTSTSDTQGSAASTPAEATNSAETEYLIPIPRDLPSESLQINQSQVNDDAEQSRMPVATSKVDEVPLPNTSPVAEPAPGENSVTFEIKREADLQSSAQTEIIGGAIATNPYTVGNKNMYIPTPKSAARARNTVAASSHAAAPPRPAMHTASGPAMWVSFAAAIIAFVGCGYCVRRKHCVQ